MSAEEQSSNRRGTDRGNAERTPRNVQTERKLTVPDNVFVSRYDAGFGYIMDSPEILAGIKFGGWAQMPSQKYWRI